MGSHSLTRLLRVAHTDMKIQLLSAALLAGAALAIPYPFELGADGEIDEECDCDDYTYEFCEALEEDYQNTPKQCKWGKWSKWSDCTTTCGEGTQARARDCKCGWG